MVFQNKVNVVKYSLILIPFLSFFIYSNVNASTITSINSGMRSYCFVNDSNCATDTNANSVQGVLPFYIIRDGGSYIGLKGYSGTASVSGGSSSNKYNKVSVDWHFVQFQYNNNRGQYNDSIIPTMWVKTSNNNTYTTTCAVGAKDNNGIRWTCSYVTDNYDPIITVGLDWGAFNSYAQSATPIWTIGTALASDKINPNSITFESVGYSYTSTADPMIAGQNTIINQNSTIIQNQNIIGDEIRNLDSDISSHYEQENDAYDNIEGQSTSDISGAENQATTNLIGVLSSFLTELQSFSATDCNLSLPFPQFIGGTQIVNICQGKDVLGNFITVVGTLAMVSFYIPLAIVLLKMIYNEIRSFTNG